MSGFKLYGEREMKQNLETLARRSPRALERSLNKFTQIELAEMKRRTPVEFGTLRDSGHAEKPMWKGNTLTQEVGFGGAAEDYAIPVHEDMEAQHSVGGPKYVESVLNESERYFAERVLKDWATDMGML